MKIALGALAIRLAEITGSEKEVASIAERVEWLAPAECVVEEELERAVSSQLHQAPETLLRRVVGKMLPTETGFLVVFEVWEGEAFVGKRKLELPGANCVAHTETLSFVLTLLLEGGKVDETEVPPAPLPSASPQPTPKEGKEAETRDSEATVDVPPSPTPKVLLSLVLGANSTPFLLPSLGLSLGGGLGIIAFAHYSLELFGGFRLAEERSLSSGEGVRLGGGGGRLEACYLFRPSVFRLGPCGAFTLEARNARGYGFSENKEETVIEAFPLFLARVDWLIHERAFVRGTFGMGASFTPHDFVNQKGVVLYSEPPLFPFVGISVGATLAP